MMDEDSHEVNDGVMEENMETDGGGSVNGQDEEMPSSPPAGIDLNTDPISSEPQSPENQDMPSQPASPESEILTSQASPRSEEDTSQFEAPSSPIKDSGDDKQIKENTDDDGKINESANSMQNVDEEDDGEIEDSDNNMGPTSPVSDGSLDLGDDTEVNETVQSNVHLDQSITSPISETSEEEGEMPPSPEPNAMPDGAEPISSDSEGEMDNIAKTNEITEHAPENDIIKGALETIDSEEEDSGSGELTESEDEAPKNVQPQSSPSKRRNIDSQIRASIQDDHGELDFDEELPEHELSKEEPKKSIKDDGEDGELDRSKEEGEADDSSDGELTEDGSEEGEIVEAESDEEFLPPVDNRLLCRFFARGHCTWGINCRFLHPGVNDIPRTSVKDRLGVPGGGEGWKPDSPEPPPSPDTPPPESAWERGLKNAKKARELASKKREEEPNFEEKRKIVPVEEEIENKENFSHENFRIERDPYYDQGVYDDYGDKPFRDEVGMEHYENFEVRWNRGPDGPYQGPPRHQQPSPQPPYQQYNKRPYNDHEPGPPPPPQRDYYDNNHDYQPRGGFHQRGGWRGRGGFRGRGGPPDGRGGRGHFIPRDDQQFQQQRPGDGPPMFNRGKDPRTQETGPTRGTGEWVDPWQRKKLPKGGPRSRSRSRGRRRQRTHSSISSSSSYSSSRSRSRSYSSSSSYSRSSYSRSSSYSSRSRSRSIPVKRPSTALITSVAAAAKQAEPKGASTKGIPAKSRSGPAGKTGPASKTGAANVSGKPGEAPKSAVASKPVAPITNSAVERLKKSGPAGIGPPGRAASPAGTQLGARSIANAMEPALPGRGRIRARGRPARASSSSSSPSRSKKRSSSSSSRSSSASSVSSASSSSSSSSSGSADSEHLYRDIKGASPISSSSSISSPTKAKSHKVRPKKPTVEPSKRERLKKPTPPSRGRPGRNYRGQRPNRSPSKDKIKSAVSAQVSSRSRDSKSSSSPTKKPSGAQPAAMKNVRETKDILKLSGQKSGIKLTLVSKADRASLQKSKRLLDDDADDEPPPKKQTKVSSKAPEKSVIGKTTEKSPKGKAAETKSPAKKPAKKRETANRREELLQQLKAVEMAIERKRSKIN